MKYFLPILLAVFLSATSCGEGSSKGTNDSDSTATVDTNANDLAAADALRESKSFAKAQKIYDQLIEEDSLNKPAYTGRAICILNTEGLPDYSQAYTDLEKAIKLGEDSKYDDRDDVKEFRAIDYYYRGQFLTATGAIEAALADFEKAIEYGYEVSECYVHRGAAKAANHDIGGAIFEFGKAIEADPENHVAWTNRGFYRSLMGDNRMALEDFDAAIKLQPDDVETILNRGYTKINMDDPDGAIEDFDLCLSKQANYMKAFKYKAVALIKKEIYKQAIELLDKVLADNPSDRKSFYYRGIAKVYDGQIPDGCADLQTAIAMGNTDGVRIVEQYCGG